MKHLLLLKAHKEICGNEVGLITNQAQLLGIKVKEEVIDSEETMLEVFDKYAALGIQFDYIYLCTHGDAAAFEIENNEKKSEMTWAKLGQNICESGLLTEDTIFLLACCRGGLFKVATDLFAVCYKVNFICGVKWSLEAADLATGFVVFLYNLIYKKAEPAYAALKASQATDYSFVCHDRAEIESHPQYENRRWQLYQEIGWVNNNGDWVEEDETIKENAGIVV